MNSSFSTLKTGLEHVNRGLLAETFAENFKHGTKFPTKKDLLAAVQTLAHKFGFQVCLCGHFIKCTRFGETIPMRHKLGCTDRKRKRKHINYLKCGCNFILGFAFVIPKFYVEGMDKVQ